jgi:uncharacterized membrane protein
MSASAALRWAWLVLSYIPLVGWIPFLSARHDREVRWHAANGLLLFAALAAVGIVATLIGIFVPSLSCIYAVAMLIAGILYLGIALLALVKALEGQRLFVPLISRYATRIARD